MTYPTSVSDEIPFGFAGYSGPLPLNLRSGWANVRFAGTMFFAAVTVTAANVATLLILNVSGSLANPGGAVDVDIFLL